MGFFKQVFDGFMGGQESPAPVVQAPAPVDNKPSAAEMDDKAEKRRKAQIVAANARGQSSRSTLATGNTDDNVSRKTLLGL